MSTKIEQTFKIDLIEWYDSLLRSPVGAVRKGGFGASDDTIYEMERELTRRALQAGRDAIFKTRCGGLPRFDGELAHCRACGSEMHMFGYHRARNKYCGNCGQLIAWEAKEGVAADVR